MMDGMERQPLLDNIRHDKTSDAPKDKWNIVYMIFYLLGIGTLLPFNFFTNARQYFVFKMRSNTSVTDKDWIDNPNNYNYLQTMFVPYLTLASMIPNVLFMFLNTAATKMLALKTRIVISTVAMIVMFLFTVILTKINSDEWQVVFLAMTITTIFIMNAGSAVLQGGIFGLSSMFPKAYTQAVMGGMGLGGVIAAGANIVALPLSDGPSETGFGYFLTAELVVIASLVGYLCLDYFEFARHYISRSGQPRSTTVSVNSDSTTDGRVEVVNTSAPMLHVFKQIWMYAMSVFVVFSVTLSTFPGLNSRIFSIHKSESHSDWVQRYFIPVTCFLFFNLGDLFGRILAGFVQWPHERSLMLPMLCFFRVVFVPLFMFCNVLPRHYTTLLFNNDYTPMILMVVFAVSSGYLGTLCMMYGPRVVDTVNIEVAGSMMSLFLSMGLAVGSAVSFILVTVV